SSYRRRSRCRSRAERTAPPLSPERLDVQRDSAELRRSSAAKEARPYRAAVDRRVDRGRREGRRSSCRDRSPLLFSGPSHSLEVGKITEKFHQTYRIPCAQDRYRQRTWQTRETLARPGQHGGAVSTRAHPRCPPGRLSLCSSRVR